jgi:hypothetical protein
MGDRHGAAADPLEWRVAAVAGKKAARDEDDARARDREPDHEVPRR